MATDSEAESATKPGPSTSLKNVLAQSEQVKEMVKESAEELSSVNDGIKEELINHGPMPGVESALERSEAVEDKVHDASDKLSAVNLALKDEVQERHALEDKLAVVTEQGAVDRHAALHDVLTNLPNRALFYDRLEHGFQQAKRHRWTLAVMFVDLDDFKIINDTYGHDAGDSVLRTIAVRLKESTRGDDTVGRYGGDEFLILINEILEETNISAIAEKIIRKIQTPCNIRIHDLSIDRIITASIGISIFPKHGTTAEALVKSADNAMYAAKRGGTSYSFAE
jgi:diguanylate cyclase (GGDEF)-like protein